MAAKTRLGKALNEVLPVQVSAEKAIELRAAIDDLIVARINEVLAMEHDIRMAVTR